MNKTIKHIFFDLDGTLTDSAPGIKNSLKYMIDKLGFPVLTDAQLQQFIGPPLDKQLQEVFQISPEQATHCVDVYREYYTEKGIFENLLYPGIEDLLPALGQEGFFLYLATSKPLVFAQQILEYFHIQDYFTAVAGVHLGPGQHTKSQIIAQLMEQNQLHSQQVVMIGDRKYDIAGAKDNQVTSIGVLYGYGGEEELRQAGADHLVESPQQLHPLLHTL